MTFSKTQKCLGVIVSVALLGFTVAKADIKSDIQNAKSGTTITCSGSYSVSGTIKVPGGVTVKGPATFNFTDSGSDGFTMKSGTGGMLQSLTIKGAKRGVNAYVACTITSCTATGNHDTGFNDNGASNVKMSGCTAYGNADSGGGNADGFGVKSASGSGNSFANCTAYNNSDDGFDFYEATAPVTVSGCLAYSNGSYNGVSGNGVGFKMGGQYNVVHTYTSCTAHNETGKNGTGFDTNHNTAAIKLTSCHSYSNKAADKLGNCVLTNCTMQQ